MYTRLVQWLFTVFSLLHTCVQRRDNNETLCKYRSSALKDTARPWNEGIQHVHMDESSVSSSSCIIVHVCRHMGGMPETVTHRYAIVVYNTFCRVGKFLIRNCHRISVGNPALVR